MSVCGTDMSETPYEDFLGSGIRPLPSGFPKVVFGFRVNTPPDFSWRSTPTTLNGLASNPMAYLSASPLAIT